MRDLETNTSRYPPDYFEAATIMHPSPAVVPLLIKSLESSNWMVREAAALLLAQIGPGAREAAPALMTAIRKTSKSGENRDALAESADSEEPRPGLMARNGLRPTAPRPGTVSQAFGRALARLAPPHESIPLLVELLGSKNPETREAATRVLGELGPEAHQASPHLLAALKPLLHSKDSAEEHTAKTLVLTLGNIVPNAPENTSVAGDEITTLRGALDAPSELIRAAAAEALGNFGPRADAAVPRLSALRDEKASRVSAAAAEALKKISPQAAPTARSGS
jgi:HEAT repeat protein